MKLKLILRFNHLLVVANKFNQISSLVDERRTKACDSFGFVFHVLFEKFKPVGSA